MRRSIVFTMVVLLAMALPLLAVGLLPAPTGFTAGISGDVIQTSWTAVEGATKYSVNIVAEYDTSGDGVADVSVDFDFGTSDRTDGLPMSDPSLTIPLTELILDVNGDGVDDTPLTAQARVKALAPGKGKGRQDSPFCAFVPVS